jgi:hypothetical protein
MPWSVEILPIIRAVGILHARLAFDPVCVAQRIERVLAGGGGWRDVGNHDCAGLVPREGVTKNLQIEKTLSRSHPVNGSSKARTGPLKPYQTLQESQACLITSNSARRVFEKGASC